MRRNNFSLVVTNWTSRISPVCKHTPKSACFVHNLPPEMVLEVAAALIQISVSLCGWPNFSELSLHTTLIAFHLVQKHFMHIFPLSNALSPWRATALLYHLRLSALGAADKINIRSTQFSSLIWHTQSAKARRVSILVCCIYLIYYISTLHTSPSPSLLGSTFFCFPVFGHKPLPLLFSLSFFLSLPSFPSEGALLKIKPGGFFNVSLEVGFFFFSSWFCCQRCQPNTPAFPLIWPFSTVFYYSLTNLLLLLHHVNLHESFTFYAPLYH